MEELKQGWQVKGTYNEACAAEGHCPYYFGRDKEGRMWMPRPSR